MAVLHLNEYMLLDSSDPVLEVSIATTVMIRSCSGGGRRAVEAVGGVAELDKMKTVWTTKTFVDDLSHSEYSSQSTKFRPYPTT